MAYGRTLLTNNNVFPTRVSADGSPKYKAGGVTIDWSTVAAVSGSDVTLPDGSIIKVGQKYLRYGQVLCKAGVAEVDTIAITGTPTGGTFTITVGGIVSSPLPYNASLAVVQTAIENIVGPGLVTVTGTAGSSYVLTFAGALGNVVVTSSGAGLTGGSSPAAGTTETTAGTATGGGLYGPYDSAASDGRQTLSRGYCFVLDQTVTQYSSGSSALSPTNDQIGGVIEGGDIFIGRVIQAGAGSASLANGPTLANFSTAFPSFTFVRND